MKLFIILLSCLLTFGCASTNKVTFDVTSHPPKSQIYVNRVGMGKTPTSIILECNRKWVDSPDSWMSTSEKYEVLAYPPNNFQGQIQSKQVDPCQWKGAGHAALYFDLGLEAVTSRQKIEVTTKSINHDKQHTDKPEIGLEIGTLVFIGADFRIFYRKPDSPWVFGIRYLDIEDDFVNESAFGFPSDDSDKEYTERYGIYLDYLFNKRPNAGSFYLSAALFQTEITIKCNSESDSDSATSPYFGGGYRGSFGDHFGYNVGVLVSSTDFEQTTSTCSNKSTSDIDVNLGLTFKF